MFKIFKQPFKKLKVIPPSTAFMAIICAVLLMDRYSAKIAKNNFLCEILFAVAVGLITAIILLLIDNNLYKKKLKENLIQLVKEKKE